MLFSISQVLRRLPSPAGTSLWYEEFRDVHSFKDWHHQYHIEVSFQNAPRPTYHYHEVSNGIHSSPSMSADLFIEHLCGFL